MVQPTFSQQFVTVVAGPKETRGSNRSFDNSLWLAMALFFCAITYSVALSYQASLEFPVQIGTQVVVQHLLSYSLMFWVWRKMPKHPSLDLIRTLFLVGIAARLILLLTDPYTSNDVSRYLFDGRILLEGLDPYRIAHDAPELANLRTQWQPPPEHAKYATLYPPLALGLYSIASSFGPDNALAVWKGMTTMASLAIAGIAYKVLKQADVLRHLPLILLSPLLILEAGESAHVDVFSALAVIAAIWAWQRRRHLTAGAVIGLGVSIKLLPLLLLLPLALFINSWHARLQLFLGTILALLVIYGVALLMGLQPVGSISLFFEKWRASSPIFYWFEPYLGHTGILYLVVGLGITIILGLFLCGLYLRHKSERAIFYLMQAALAVPLVLSPVIFPWYLMPLAILFALRPNLILALWLITLPISYEVLNQYLCCGVWAPANWTISLIGASLIVGAVYSLFLGYRTSQSTWLRTRLP